MRVLLLGTVLAMSGFCALIYQSVWLREFRLIFGGSTMASASVVAIFMAGLGVGSLYFGKRADRTSKPILLYGKLELVIALSAAISPFLLDAARAAFLSMGGSFTMGQFLATLIRLVLSTVILAVPTFCMGATLPAVARAAETANDENRRYLAVLYGCNTLGAVAGVMFSNFLLFETLGNRQTLWAAALLNLIVVVAARVLSRKYDTDAPARSAASADQAATRARAPQKYLIFAAGVVGFAFMLMELVWYRMLSPILGGSTFTFAIILAVALLGIGLGGILYSLIGRSIPITLATFGITCGAEALFMAIPFAMGDLVAEWAWVLRSLGTFGFFGQVGGWALICAIVVFPAAIISGVQFPLLIALMGKGEANIGSDTARAYVANMIGAILGSLAGGFGFLPAFSATGSWMVAVTVLALLAVGASWRSTEQWAGRLSPTFLACSAVALLFISSPTAFWRHSGIGAGRIGDLPKSVNHRIAVVNDYNRSLIWQKDGIESGVAMVRGDGMAFVVNGKVDGHAHRDAGTQIMSTMLGALLKPDIKNACVIGLGTGSSSGWLASLPNIERVDVIEMEPAICRVSDDCAPINQNASKNSKMHLHIGDGREWLLTTKHKYDFIASEPSNPYRAGIASLFTKDFYEVSATKLNKGGIFGQWLQAYEVDSEAVCSVYATFTSVFPHVQSWATLGGDLMLIGSQEPIPFNADELRARIAQEPYKSALAAGWKVDNLEGVLARYLGGDKLAFAVAKGAKGFLNTDDLTSLEFAFARSVGKSEMNRLKEIRQSGIALGDHRPDIKGNVHWDDVDSQVVILSASEVPDSMRAKVRDKLRFLAQWRNRKFNEASEIWSAAPWRPLNLSETSMLAFTLAVAGNPNATAVIERVAAYSKSEAAFLKAIQSNQQGKKEEALNSLMEGFKIMKEDPWPADYICSRALDLAIDLAKGDQGAAKQLYSVLNESFSINRMWHERQVARLKIAIATEDSPENPQALAALEAFEPHPIWENSTLQFRVGCYRRFGSPYLAKAERDLACYNKNRDRSIEELSFVRSNDAKPLLESNGNHNGNSRVPGTQGSQGEAAAPQISGDRPQPQQRNPGSSQE